MAAVRVVDGAENVTARPVPRAAVRLPVTRMPPETSSVAAGVVVRIPTFPAVYAMPPEMSPHCDVAL